MDLAVRANRLAPLLLTCALTPSCATRQKHLGVTPVEVWRESDDGLTIRFCEVLEDAFGRALSFRLVPAGTASALIVTVTDHVEAENGGQRVELKYRVAYSDATGENLGAIRGHCWEDDPSEFATRVVDQARKAARRMRDKP